MNPLANYLKDVSERKLPPRILPFHRNNKVLTLGAGDSYRNQRGIGASEFHMNMKYTEALSASIKVNNGLTQLTLKSAGLNDEKAEMFIKNLPRTV